MNPFGGCPFYAGVFCAGRFLGGSQLHNNALAAQFRIHGAEANEVNPTMNLLLMNAYRRDLSRGDQARAEREWSAWDEFASLQRGAA